MKFRPKDEDFSVKRSMDEVLQIAQHELQKKGIDLTVTNANDLPSTVRGDPFKFKQVLLNLLLQSISGTYKGVVKLKTEMVRHSDQPHVAVEIDNSKFELHKKDNMRIMKLSQATEFKKVLESKVDINLKIAKILINALGWKLDFSAFKGSKFTFTLPVKSDGRVPIENIPQPSAMPSTNLITMKELENEI